MKSKNHLIGMLLSALIPVAVFLILFMRPHITQGQYTLLVSDLNGQYVNYFLYFKEAIANGDNLFYSFSMLLGGDTFSLIGYYLLSPLNLILLFWPASDIAYGIFVVITIKVGLSGLTSYLYFSRKRENAFYPLIFSTTYALGGYIFAYFMHVMWLDALYLLPLVILGLELLVEEKKKVLYIISLALAIICCYYTGYMIAGFSLVYFIYLQMREKQAFKRRLATFFRFCWTSILAAALSAITLFPSLLSQMGNRQAKPNTENGILHSIPEILAKLFTGVYNYDEFLEGSPQIYFGMLILFLVVFFLISIRRNARNVISALFLLLTLTACFSIGILDKIWHGMATPNSFYHRYSFVYIFSCIMIAEESFSNKKFSVTLPKLFISNVITIAMGIWVLSAKLEQINTFLLISDIVIVVIVSFLFYCYKNGSKKSQMVALSALIVIQITQLFINASVYIGVHTYDDHSVEGFYSEQKPIINDINSLDNGFYRMEKTYSNSQNDAMMLSYKGLSHFSSADKSYIRNFMGNIGYNKSYDFWVYYDKGATPAADSLLGVKYILSDTALEHYTASSNILALYQNSLALQIGTVCSSQIKHVTLTPDLPFENQKLIYDALLNTHTDLFTAYETSTPLLYNVTTEGSLYVKVNPDMDGIVSFSFVAQDSNPTYMYLPCIYNPGVQVCVNGEYKGEYLVPYHRGIFELGSFAENELVTIELYLQGQHAGYENVQIYSLDMQKLTEAAKSLQSQGWTVNKYNSGNVNATFTVDNDNSVLLITIPYNKNWNITVDGNPASVTEVLGALIAVDVEKGTHIIEMHYTPAGLSIGCIVSAVALLLFTIVAIIEKKNAPAKKASHVKRAATTAKQDTPKSEPAKPTYAYYDPAKQKSSKHASSIQDKEKRNIILPFLKKFFDKNKSADKSVNKFLYAQYKGHCQICSKQMTDKDDNLIWHAFSLFKPDEGNTDASLPVAWDKVCVCFTCKATLQYGNVSLREFLSEALTTPPYKSEKKLKFRIRIQNETTNITYTTKHLKHLQTALSGDSGKARIKRFRYDI